MEPDPFQSVAAAAAAPVSEKGTGAHGRYVEESISLGTVRSVEFGLGYTVYVLRIKGLGRGCRLLRRDGRRGGQASFRLGLRLDLARWAEKKAR